MVTNTLITIDDLIIELTGLWCSCVRLDTSVRDEFETGPYTFISSEDVAVDDERNLQSPSAILPRTSGGRDSGGIYEVGGAGQAMKVVFRKSAGISNPTEAGTFFASI